MRTMRRIALVLVGCVVASLVVLAWFTIWLGPLFGIAVGLILHSLSTVVASLGTYRVGSLIYHAIAYNPLREGLSAVHAGILLAPVVVFLAIGVAGYSRRDLGA